MLKTKPNKTKTNQSMTKWTNNKGKNMAWLKIWTIQISNWNRNVTQTNLTIQNWVQDKGQKKKELLKKHIFTI